VEVASQFNNSVLVQVQPPSVASPHLNKNKINIVRHEGEAPYKRIAQFWTIAVRPKGRLGWEGRLSASYPSLPLRLASAFPSSFVHVYLIKAYRARPSTPQPSHP